MDSIPPLATERLIIRPLAVGDLEDCHRLNVEIDWIDPGLDLAANRARRASWLAWTIDSYRELARLRSPPYGERAVTSRADGAFLGLVGLVPSLAAFSQLPGFGGRPDHRVRPEIGLFWALRPSAQGHGYATEAARALVAYAFGVLKLERLVATTERENLASAAVMRRLGMRVETNGHPSSEWPQVVGVLEAPG